MISVNQTIKSLPPYPMEELARIKGKLLKEGKTVFDFGTGDPRIPTWEPIRQALKEAVPHISQYPSVRGKEELRAAQLGYLKRRFQIDTSNLGILPTQGSKEAVFSIGLCLVDRGASRQYVIYPDPGYPVYRSSALFSGGVPYPVPLREADHYLLKPWDLPKQIQKEAAFVWVNYPHNPTGHGATYQYWKDLIAWGQANQTIILSDDCYVDIYDPKWDEDLKKTSQPTVENDPRPLCPLIFSSKGIISFMSLSKRSGLTGYRSGFMAGDPELLEGVARARANFGSGTADFIQAAATVAWSDDTHVEERRKIFAARLNIASPVMQKLGLLEEPPQTAFYLWCKVPPRYPQDDVAFCLALAQEGMITSPSQWLSESVKGYFRLALVPDEKNTIEAMALFEKFVRPFC